GSPFRLSIDFQGGSIYELKFTAAGATEENIDAAFEQFGIDDTSIQQLGDADQYRWSVRGPFIEQSTVAQLLDQLDTIAPLDRNSVRVEQVSATVGGEVAQSAVLAVLVAALVITGFIV